MSEDDRQKRRAYVAGGRHIDRLGPTPAHRPSLDLAHRLSLLGWSFTPDGSEEWSLSNRAWLILRATLVGGALRDRLHHSVSVGMTLSEHYRDKPAAERDVARACGLLHDVGYGVPVTGFHPTDGAHFIESTALSFLAPQIAWHSTASYEAARRGLSIDVPRPEDTRLRLALWLSDFTVSPQGERVTVSERVREIRSRYPADSPAVLALDDAISTLSQVRTILGPLL